MTPIKKARFTALLGGLKTPLNMENTDKFTTEQYQAMSGYIVESIYSILPKEHDDYLNLKEVLRVMNECVLQTWNKMSDANPNLRSFTDAMKIKYPIPEDPVTYNECNIVINTVCGETRTIEMTQEVTSVEYMGKTLKKTTIGEFLQ